MPRHILENDNFAYLTYALVLLLFVSALVDSLRIGFGSRVIEATVMLTLVAGIWSIRKQRRWFPTAVGLVAAIAVVLIGGLFLDLSGLYVTHLLILLCFVSLSAWVVAKQVLFAGRADANIVMGAICLYLLLGVIWAALYLLVDAAFPGSFSGPLSPEHRNNFPDLLYFSFTSLTTQGFGDFVPVLPLARFLVYVEGIFGQLYIAIVIASLVGIRISSRRP